MCRNARTGGRAVTALSLHARVQYLDSGSEHLHRSRFSWMLLLSVKLVGGAWAVEVGEDGAVDPAGHVAFQAADDLALGQSLGGAAGDVGLGPRVVVHADQDDAPQRVVGLAVAAAVDSLGRRGCQGAGWWGRGGGRGWGGR